MKHLAARDCRAPALCAGRLAALAVARAAAEETSTRARATCWWCCANRPATTSRTKACTPFGKISARACRRPRVRIRHQLVPVPGRHAHAAGVRRPRQSMQSASPDDLGACSSRPSRRCTLAVANLRRATASRSPQPWSGGLMQVQGSFARSHQQLLPRSRFLAGACSAAIRMGSWSRCRDRGGLVYAPASDDGGRRQPAVQRRRAVRGRPAARACPRRCTCSRTGTGPCSRRRRDAATDWRCGPASVRDAVAVAAKAQHRAARPICSSTTPGASSAALGHHLAADDQHALRGVVRVHAAARSPAWAGRAGTSARQVGERRTMRARPRARRRRCAAAAAGRRRRRRRAPQRRAPRAGSDGATAAGCGRRGRDCRCRGACAGRAAPPRRGPPCAPRRGRMRGGITLVATGSDAPARGAARPCAQSRSAQARRPARRGAATGARARGPSKHRPPTRRERRPHRDGPGPRARSAGCARGRGSAGGLRVDAAGGIAFALRIGLSQGVEDVGHARVQGSVRSRGSSTPLRD